MQAIWSASSLLLISSLIACGSAPPADKAPEVSATPDRPESVPSNAPSSAPSSAPSVSASDSASPSSPPSAIRASTAYLLGDLFSFSIAYSNFKRKDLFDANQVLVRDYMVAMAVQFPAHIPRRQAELSVADQMTQRDGASIGQDFLLGADLGSEFLTTQLFSEADLLQIPEHRQTVAEIGKELAGSGIAATVWKAAYDRYAAHPSLSNLLELEQKVSGGLGVEGDIVHSPVAKADTLKPDIARYAKELKDGN